MDIPSDIRPPDPPARRRPGEPARAGAPRDGTPSTGEGTDSVRLSAPSAEQIASWVDAIASLAPERLHQVADLQARIADGSYRAHPEDLAGPLLDHLDGLG